MHLACSSDRDVVKRGLVVLPGMVKESCSIGLDLRPSTLNRQSGIARDLHTVGRDVLPGLPGQLGFANSTQELLFDASNHFAWCVKTGVGDLIQLRAVALVADACVHRCP